MKHLLPLTLMSALFLNACKKNENMVGTITKQGKTYEIGAVLPELRTVKNDTAWIALYPHARVFFMDMKIKNSERYIKMIQSAAKEPAPVRARIFQRLVYSMGGEEIAEIYPPTAQDVAAFKAAMKK